MRKIQLSDYIDQMQVHIFCILHHTLNHQVIFEKQRFIIFLKDQQLDQRYLRNYQLL